MFMIHICLGSHHTTVTKGLHFTTGRCILQRGVAFYNGGLHFTTGGAFYNGGLLVTTGAFHFTTGASYVTMETKPKKSNTHLCCQTVFSINISEVRMWQLRSLMLRHRLARWSLVCCWGHLRRTRLIPRTASFGSCLRPSRGSVSRRLRARSSIFGVRGALLNTPHPFALRLHYCFDVPCTAALL